MGSSRKESMRPLRPDRIGTTDTGSRPDPVVGWRTHHLRQAGFSQQLAHEVAGDRAYDLHALLELTDRGCPPQLAVRILAPLARGDLPC
jgi:hypothetical protein